VTAGGLQHAEVIGPSAPVSVRNAELFFFAIERRPTARANPLREPTDRLDRDQTLTILAGATMVRFLL
jgi:hypothetical protein